VLNLFYFITFTTNPWNRLVRYFAEGKNFHNWTW